MHKLTKEKSNDKKLLSHSKDDILLIIFKEQKILNSFYVSVTFLRRQLYQSFLNIAVSYFQKKFCQNLTTFLKRWYWHTTKDYTFSSQCVFTRIAEFFPHV